jgi:hypothetical protein
MCVVPVQRGGQPLLAAGPADGFAGTEIDDMRATAEGVEAGSGAGQGILEPPEAGEVEFFSEAQDEADDGLDVAVVVVMNPEAAAFRRILAHEVEARDLRIISVLIRSAEFLKQGECAGGVVGGADAEQA